MLTRCLKLVSNLCFLLIISLPTQAGSVIHLGVLDWQDEAKTASHWAPTLAAIKKQLPHNSVELHLLNLEGIAIALEDSKLDYLITNPGHYVQLSQTYQLSPLASLNNPFLNNAQQAIGSVVLVTAENQAINGWQDLRGLTLGAVNLDAFGGFQLVWDELEQQGLNPKVDIAEWKITGFPMQQLFDLLVVGKVDAIVVRSCLAEMLAAEGKINLADYRVIGAKNHPDYPCISSTPLYPDWPFLSTGKQLPAEVSQVVLALLQSSDQQPAQWLAPLSYQPVYELFERLRLGPFAAFPRNPLLNIIYAYRYELLLLAGFLLLIFAHHIRVGYLVGKRSQELQQAMQASQTKQKELEHLSRIAVMGELAAGLAHEINQPLTAILNYAQGSQRLLKQLDSQAVPQQPSLLEAAQKITAQGERAAEIIRNLRAFMRKGKSGQENLDPKQLLQEVRLFMDASLQRQNVSLHLHLANNLSPIKANRVEFLQIIINLLSNALDAMQKQEVGRINIYLEEDQEGKFLLLDVVDSGEGLTKEVEERIFEPFFTTRLQGMGLGLSLSKTLATSQGAKLSLHRHSAGGACAHLEWPLASK